MLTTGAARPAVDEIVFRVIADDSARFLALQAGDIQGFEQAVVEDLVTAEAADDLYVMTRPSTQYRLSGLQLQDR